MDFVVPAGHRIELKECEKRYKHLDLARELKKLWDIKVTIIPIVSSVTKRWVQRLEDWDMAGRVDPVQTTALLRSVRIQRRVLET